MPTFVVRDAEKTDREAIQHIFSLYWNKPEDLEHHLNRLDSFINKDKESIETTLHYLVVEAEEEILGVLGFRDAPQKLIEYSTTSKPMELYVLFMKQKGKGAGRVLVEKMIQIARALEYTEVIVFSSDVWKSSWGFYDKLGFERVVQTPLPDGRVGQIWRRGLGMV